MRGNRLAKSMTAFGAIGLFAMTATADRSSDDRHLRSGVPGEPAGPSVAGDSATSCQGSFICDFVQPPLTPDPCDERTVGHTHGTGFGAGGTLAATSDTEGPLRVADDFAFNTNGDLETISWMGINLDFTDVSDCTGEIPNEFSIQILGNVPGDNLPDDGNVIADITHADGVLTVTDTGFSTAGIPVKHYRLELTTPIFLEVNVYHLVIQHTAPIAGAGGCNWLWEAAGPGNARSAQDGGDEPMPGVWDSGDITDYDLAFCLGFQSSGVAILPPRMTLERVDGRDNDTLCCTFRWTVRNRNSFDNGNGDLQEFFVAFDKGMDANSNCEAPSDFYPPAGWSTSVCEGWAPGRPGRVIYRVFGGNLPEQGETFGHIVTDVNGLTIQTLDSDDSVPAYGIAAWAGKEASLSQFCGTTFGPLDGEVGDWGQGSNHGIGVCDVVPIPAVSTINKVLLVALIGAIGAGLLLRSRTPAMG